MARTSVLSPPDALAGAVAAARVSGTAVALAFVDVNDFRRVSDSLGTELGEELLSQVGVRLRAAVRPDDLVAREGGQGFLVLLRELPIEGRAHAARSAILRLADACGCDVVAEGVERPEHAAFLVAGGCRIAQGFHFGRPVPAPEITALLEASIASERRC